MVYLSILVFFALTFFLGYSATSFVKNSGNFLERNLMRIGIGLALIPLVGLMLNIIHVPIDWKIILGLSLIYPVYYVIRFRPKPKFEFKLTKADIGILVMLLIFLANFYVYASGAFRYPYLEDDDSWSHAIGAKYASVEKNVFTQQRTLHYVDPYPPSYDMVMGIMHQANDSLYFTLKFFNALIISLSIIFFYFFVNELLGNRNKALFAAFALASVPAFMSHFIWAISLAVPLYFVCFYALEKIKQDNKWWIVAGLSMATTFTVTPTHSTYFGLMLILYVGSKMIVERKILFYHLGAGILGASLSFLLWWLPMLLKHGFVGVLEGIGFSTEILSTVGSAAAFRGTGDRAYNFADFFIAQKQNMVNNPIGIGIVLFILLLLSIILAYYLVYKNSKNLKEQSKAKYYILNGIEISSIILFIIGIFLFVTSNNYDITKADQIWQLTSHMKTTLPFLFISLLIVILLLFYLSEKIPEESRWVSIALVWLLFTFYAVNASIYPIKLSAFRTWMLFVIPLCMLAAEAAFGIMNLAKGLAGNAAKYIILILLIGGIFFTSTQQKITVNTSPNWPPGGFWTSADEITSYIWMKDNLPKNSHVFTFANDGTVIGMDMYTCKWCDEVKEYKKNGFNQTAQDTYDWFKSNDYDYVIIDGQTVSKFGLNESLSKLKEFEASGRFHAVFSNNGGVIFKVA